MSKRALLLCDAQRVFEHPLGNIVNKILNMDFTPRVISPIKRLMKDEKNEVTVIGMDSEAMEKLQKARVPYKSFQEYVSQGMFDQAGERAMSLVRGNKVLRDNPVFRDSLYYNGIFLWDLVELYVHDTTRRAIFDIELVKHILDAERPDIVMATDGRSLIGSAALAVANMRQIPSSVLSPTLILRLKHTFKKHFKVYFLRLYEWWGNLWANKPKIRGNLGYKARKGKSIEKENKILVVSDEFRHAPQVIPWAKELVKNARNEVLVVGKGPWARTYREENILFEAFGNYAPKGLNKKVKQKVASMLKNWEGIKNKPLLRESIIYDGFSIFDLLWDDISYHFKYYFYRIAKVIEITKCIIEQEKPHVIVVLDDRSWFGKAVVRVCREQNVPSLIIQHGSFGDAPHLGPTHATKMQVYGEYSKKVFMKRGVEPEKIVVTGGPQWDELAKGGSISKAEFCRQLGLDKDKGIILLATDVIFDHDISEKVVVGVLEAVREFLQMQLLIRAHPAEPTSLYKSIIKRAGARDVAVFKKPHDLDSIRACDILITRWSTVGLEAMIAGKPVITINLSGARDPLPYAESGAAIGVYRVEDIAPAIGSVLSDSAVQERLARCREKFVYEQAYKPDGKASQRVAELIEGMVQEWKTVHQSQEK